MTRHTRHGMMYFMQEPTRSVMYNFEFLNLQGYTEFHDQMKGLELEQRVGPDSSPERSKPSIQEVLNGFYKLPI